MQERWLKTGDAAHLLGELAGRPYGPGIIRYHNSQGRLRAVRTTTGARLIRESDIRRLAARLAPRTDRGA
jgi:hypothetical protein